MEALPLPKTLTFAEMAALYDGLRTMKEVGLALASQGRFRLGHNYNEAGNILDDLCELIGRTKDAVSDMGEKAQPSIHSESYSDDFANRALVIVQAEIDNNGIISAAEQAMALYGPTGEAGEAV